MRGVLTGCSVRSYIGVQSGTIRYFLNAGRATTPVYTEQTGSDNPFSGVQGLPVVTNGNADPANMVALWCGDIDEDGDNDWYGALCSGFIMLTLCGFVLSFVGVFQASVGTIKHFKNTGSASSPAFVEQTGSLNPFHGLNVGDFPAPWCGDFDGDGDNDWCGALPGACAVCGDLLCCVQLHWGETWLNQILHKHREH